MTIIDATRSVTGDGEHQLHIPDLTDQDRDSVSSCFDEGFVSSVGSKISQFEKVRRLHRCKACDRRIKRNSGTSHSSYNSWNWSNDEVLVPALTLWQPETLFFTVVLFHILLRVKKPDLASTHIY